MKMISALSIWNRGLYTCDFSPVFHLVLQQIETNYHSWNGLTFQTFLGISIGISLQCCMFCVWLQQIIVTNYYGGEHLPWLKLKWHFFRNNWLVFCVVLRQSTYLFRPSGINTAKYFLTTNIYLLGCSPPRDFSLAENLMNSFWCI